LTFALGLAAFRVESVEAASTYLRSVLGEIGRLPVPAWPASLATARNSLIAIDLDQPLVADPEMVGDFVQNDALDLRDEPVWVVAVESNERPTVDRDLVREDVPVEGATPCQGHALVETEQALAGCRLVFDDDRDVRHQGAQILGQRIERIVDELLESTRPA
jgi:hypothetical protein